MQLVSKNEAIKQGEKFYFTGIPCCNGHVSLRRVKKGSCLECERSKPRAYLVNNREHHLQRQRKYNKQFYAENSEAQINRVKKYKSENKGTASGHERKRQACKINRTPTWADLDAIKLFYKNCPPEMTVDHIIPLQGKLVSGLHVANNLQYLTHIENAIKNNRFEVS